MESTWKWRGTDVLPSELKLLMTTPSRLNIVPTQYLIIMCGISVFHFRLENAWASIEHGAYITVKTGGLNGDQTCISLYMSTPIIHTMGCIQACIEELYFWRSNTCRKLFIVTSKNSSSKIFATKSFENYHSRDDLGMSP